MARCGCASDRCNCNFIAGDNVIITGVGTRSSPYVIQVVTTADAPTGGGTAEGWEPGDIKATGRPSASPGWLMCDGSIVERGAFPDLYAAIGTAYGAGDGISTFRLPNLNGRVPLGADGSHPRGTSGGSDSTTLELRHLPQHSHSMAHTHTINHDHDDIGSTGSHDHSLDLSADPGGSNMTVARGTTNVVATSRGAVKSDGQHTHNVPSYNGNSGASSATNTGNAGSASPDSVDTTPPYQAVNYMVKT